MQHIDLEFLLLNLSKYWSVKVALIQYVVFGKRNNFHAVRFCIEMIENFVSHLTLYGFNIS